MEEISAIDGIGPVLAGNIYSYFHDKENNQKLDRLTGAAPAGSRADQGTETQTPPAPPAGPMVHCTHCGTWYREGAGRCPVCGTQLQKRADNP